MSRKSYLQIIILVAVFSVFAAALLNLESLVPESKVLVEKQLISEEKEAEFQNNLDESFNSLPEDQKQKAQSLPQDKRQEFKELAVQKQEIEEVSASAFEELESILADEERVKELDLKADQFLKENPITQ